MLKYDLSYWRERRTRITLPSEAFTDGDTLTIYNPTSVVEDLPKLRIHRRRRGPFRSRNTRAEWRSEHT